MGSGVNVGDTIRATLVDDGVTHTYEGEVWAVRDAGYLLGIHGSYYVAQDGGEVEVLKRALPPEPPLLSIVRCRKGHDAFQRHGNGWHDTVDGYETDLDWEWLCENQDIEVVYVHEEGK